MVNSELIKLWCCVESDMASGQRYTRAKVRWVKVWPKTETGPCVSHLTRCLTGGRLLPPLHHCGIRWPTCASQHALCTCSGAHTDIAECPTEDSNYDVCWSCSRSLGVCVRYSISVMVRHRLNPLTLLRGPSDPFFHPKCTKNTGLQIIQAGAVVT